MPLHLEYGFSKDRILRLAKKVNEVYEEISKPMFDIDKMKRPYREDLDSDCLLKRLHMDDPLTEIFGDETDLFEERYGKGI